MFFFFKLNRGTHCRWKAWYLFPYLACKLLTLLDGKIFLPQDVLCFTTFSVKEPFQWCCHDYLIFIFFWLNKDVLLFTFNFLRSRRSLCTVGYSLALSFAKICLLFKIISLTRLIAWSTTWCCLMLFDVVDFVDWWRTWSSCSFSKLLIVFTAQSQASL